MSDTDIDWDNEADHQRERATDPDYQRMEFAHTFGAWDAPGEVARKKAEMDRLFPITITTRCGTCTEYTDLCDCPTDGCPQEQWEVTTPREVYARGLE